MNEKNIINKWYHLGLFDDVENLRTTTFACELIARHLLDEINIDKYHNDVDVFIFPVIIKIFKQIEDDVSINLINYMAIEILESFVIDFEKIRTTQKWVNRERNKTDIEAEFLNTFCEKYIVK